MASLYEALKGEKARTGEKQEFPPKAKHISIYVNEKELRVENKKGTTWKQMLIHAKECQGSLAEQVENLNEWLAEDKRKAATTHDGPKKKAQKIQKVPAAAEIEIMGSPAYASVPAAA